MAGAEFRSAVRAIFWANLFLAGFVATTRPELLLQLPNLKDAPPSTTCAPPPVESYRAADNLHAFLQVALCGATILTFHIRGVAVGWGGGSGLLPKDTPVPLRFRIHFVVTVAYLAAIAVLAGRYLYQLLQLKLGMTFVCLSGSVQGILLATSATAGASVVYFFVAIALRGIRSW